MLKESTYNNCKVQYSIEGSGSCIVLVHGLCEDGGIWDNFTAHLKEQYTVVRLNLPGNGVSDCPEQLSVDFMAATLKTVLDKEGIQKAIVIGHSMRGYAALAFADLFKEHLAGLGLFHSYALPDDETKKEGRNKSIDFIQRNGHAGYIKTLFNDLFADDYKLHHQLLIDRMTDDAIARNNEQALIATLAALRDRPDRTYVLQEISVPVLFIAGKLDMAVPYTKLAPQMTLPAIAQVCILDDVKHMGMCEAPEQTLKAIERFARYIYGIKSSI